MKVRYHISNGITFAEFPKTPQGLQQAKDFRVSRPDFKRRHIQEVIQAYPSKISLGVVYELT